MANVGVMVCELDEWMTDKFWADEISNQSLAEWKTIVKLYHDL